MIQQADDDYDHHCDYYDYDDDLGELQLRCDRRGKCISHVPFAPSLSSPDACLLRAL